MSKSEKIKVDYKKLKAQGKKILDRVNGVYKVETRYAIILAINNFGSSNIKKLARILGKNEATIYHHLKDLTREPELLIVDNKKTRENKGIFYKLSKIADKNSIFSSTRLVTLIALVYKCSAASSVNSVFILLTFSNETTTKGTRAITNNINIIFL